MMACSSCKNPALYLVKRCNIFSGIFFNLGLKIKVNGALIKNTKGALYILQLEPSKSRRLTFPSAISRV